MMGGKTKTQHTHHFDGGDLNEDGLGECHIGGFRHVHPLAGQGLNDVPVAKVVEVRVPIDVGQR